MTEDIPYCEEYVTFDELKKYGVEFDETMRTCDAGLIRRRDHINSRGSVVYTFHRGDTTRWCESARS